VTALVSRYKGRIKFYEGWNEPDYRHFWTGTEEELIELQKHAYQIIHRIDPQARVLTPTPTARNPGEWLGRFFDAGGGAYADIISFHGYTHPDSEKIVGIIKGVQDAMRQYHQEEKPLWITEGSWGKPTKLSDPDLQAGFVAKHNLLIWANGVERFYWYGWDYPTGRLWDEDNGIHNTGIAYREIQKWMIGSIMDQPCAMDGQETWTCGLKFADGSHGLVVWNSQQTQKYHPKEKFTQVFDLEGHSSSMSDDITIGDKPVLLK
jgi:hypothetical protein